jgi:hypothetical protein
MNWGKVGHLGESGEYWMRRSWVLYFHVLSSEAGSLRLCWLRTTSVGPWGTSINYVLAHAGLMGSHKLISFNDHRVGWYLSYLQDVHGIVCGPPRDACRGITWKRCTRVTWARLDSLIIIANCCPTRGLHDYTCVVLLGYPLQGVNWSESLRHSRKWVMARSLCSNIIIQHSFC